MLQSAFVGASSLVVGGAVDRFDQASLDDEANQVISNIVMICARVVRGRREQEQWLPDCRSEK